MTHSLLKQYLTRVMEQDQDAIASYEVAGKIYPIHEVFGLDRGEDYYELYSDIGVNEDGQDLKSSPMSAEDIYNVIYGYNASKGGTPIPDETRVDIIVGNEDGKDKYSEEIKHRDLIFTSSRGKYIPHKKDFIETGRSLFIDNKTISIEEEREETLQQIINETIEDMRSDFGENAGETLSIKEQEVLGMFEYTHAELEAVANVLDTENKYTLYNGISYHYDTPKAVISVLEEARQRANDGFEDTEIRLDYGYTTAAAQDGEHVTPGISWGEENDIKGTVGKSFGGSVSIPLLIEDGENGGSGILDHCIVAICDKEGKVLYKHNDYQPYIDWENAKINTIEGQEYPFEIEGIENKSGKSIVVARFENKVEAFKYLTEKLEFEVPVKKKKTTNKQKTTNKIKTK